MNKTAMIVLICLLTVSLYFTGCSKEPIADDPSDTVTTTTTTPAHSPYEDFDLVIDEDHVILVGYTGSEPHVIIPDEYNGLPITEINHQAFIGRSIEAVTIPDTVTTIDDRAFTNCEQLTAIHWGANVSTLGKGAFSGCTSLKELYIPKSITSIGSLAFVGNTALTSLVIEEGVKCIGEGSSVFSGCTSLEQVELPVGIEEIGQLAFSDCTNLKSVTFLGNAPSSVGKGVFEDCAEDLVIYYTDGTTGWTDTVLKEYTLQVSVAGN